MAQVPVHLPVRRGRSEGSTASVGGVHAVQSTLLGRLSLHSCPQGGPWLPLSQPHPLPGSS